MVDTDREAKRVKVDSGSDDISDDGGLGFSLNGYKGFQLDNDSSKEKDCIPTVALNDLTPEKFFQDFVSKRRPCVIEGSLSLKDVFTYESLTKIAGDGIVQVEKRLELNEAFGQLRTAQRQVEMTIQDFLDKLQDEKESEFIYLTTQTYEHKEDLDDESSICYYPHHPFGTPCRQLLEAGKIPFQPALAGNLIIQSCNLWMGRSKEGSSSGLHHDYHDNIYNLVRGRKLFRLFSPDQAEYLATNGTIDRVYFNGRISYAGDEVEVHADGRPINDDSEADEIDDNDDTGVVIGKGFDYISSDDEDRLFEDANDDEEFLDDFNEDIDDNDKEDASKRDEGIRGINTKSEPIPSFSRIDLSLPKITLMSKFPQLRNTIQHSIEVREGQMLYLPAGWFHEVTSFSNDDFCSVAGDVNEKINDKLKECHCALNYWFHPPDALESFSKPYTNDFWKKELQKALSKHSTK